MLKNESPKWKVSEELIKKIVEEEFGVYVESEKGEVSVFFLPKDVTDRIPEVDVDLFIQWYDFYSRILASEINLNGIFESFMDARIATKSIDRLKIRLESQIRVFDHTNKISAKEMLLRTFGFYGK